MVQLTANKPIAEKDGQRYELPSAAAQRFFQGAIVCRNAAGRAVRAITALNLVALGVAEAAVDNTLGADGAVSVPYRSGVFLFENSTAADLITAADIGTDCFIVDDQTVARTNGTNTRSRLGRVDALEADGRVWVRVGVPF